MSELTKHPPDINQVLNVADRVGVKWANVKFTPKDLAEGMRVEYEHGSDNPITNVTNDDPLMTAKIALAHLYEKKSDGNTQYDYYDALKIIEDAPSGWYRNVNPTLYWINKCFGWIIVTVLILLALYIIAINDPSSMIISQYFVKIVLISSIYLLVTWG